MTHREWYFHLNGKTVGPIPKEEFSELFRSGKLAPDTPVWAEGLKTWVPASQVKGLIPESQLSPFDIQLDPPPIPAQHNQHAGRGVSIIKANPAPHYRLAAAILDGVIYYVMSVISGIFLVLILSSSELETLESINQLVMFFVSWFYYAFMESSSKQGTVGKILLGFAVTDLGGNRISFWRATGRYFAKILSVLTLGIGYAMCLWTEDRQCLHDMVAGCIMYEKR